MLCLINITPHKLNKVKITQENGIISVSAENDSKGYGYLFKFESKDEKIYFDSDAGLLVLDEEYEKLTLGEKYNVSVSVKGEIESANSSFSNPVEWTAVKYLEAPKIKIQDSLLTWEDVAEATSYTIHYNPNGEIKTFVTSDTTISLDLLDGGKCNIFVKATSSNENFLSSESSNILDNVTIIHEMRPVRDVQFNSSGQLIVYVYEKVDMLNLYLGQNEINYERFTLTGLTLTKIGDYYKIVCDIDLIYNNEEKIGITPAASNEYSKYTGSIIWVNV